MFLNRERKFFHIRRGDKFSTKHDNIKLTENAEVFTRRRTIWHKEFADEEKMNLHKYSRSNHTILRFENFDSFSSLDITAFCRTITQVLVIALQ